MRFAWIAGCVVRAVLTAWIAEHVAWAALTVPKTEHVVRAVLTPGLVSIMCVLYRFGRLCMLLP